MEGQDPTIKPPMRWRPLMWVLATMLVYVLLLRFPIIQFSSHRLNTILGLILLVALPWAFVTALFQVGRWWATSIGFVLALILGIITPMSLLGLMFIGGAAFDPIQKIDWNGSNITVYRLDAGAISSTDIEVRQERAIFPGILSVRPLLFVRRCSSVFIEPTSQGIRVINRSPACAGPPIGKEFPLKRFLYF